MNLPELVRQYNDISSFLIDNNGEITDKMAESLAIVEKNLPEKCDNYRFFIDKLKADSVLWKEQAEVFRKASKGCDLLVDRLKETLKLACISMDKTELLGKTYRWLLQGSSIVVFDNEELIPSKYKTVVQTFTINKKQIADDIKAGIDVPGAHIEKTQHVVGYLNNKKGQRNEV